jgi:hypothetical protein
MSLILCPDCAGSGVVGVPNRDPQRVRVYDCQTCSGRGVARADESGVAR